MIRKTNYLLLTSVMGAAMTVISCSEETLDMTPDRNELYAREFVKTFGTPDPKHDWSTATTAGLKIIAAERTNIKVYAEVDTTLYIFADLPGFVGEHPVPVTIPSDVNELLVVTDNGNTYRCSSSATLDLRTATPENPYADRSRGIGLDLSPYNKYKIPTYITTDDYYITLDVDKNLQLKQILSDPLNSPYLVTKHSFGTCGYLFPDEYGGIAYQGSLSIYDCKIFPLQINTATTSANNSVIGVMAAWSASTSYAFIEFPLEHNMRRDLIEGSYGANISHKISYSTNNGSSWKSTTMPPFESGNLVKYKCFDLTCGEGAPVASYYVKETNNTQKISPEVSASAISYTFTPFNYDHTETVNGVKGWGNNFFDAKISELNTCYCSHIKFKDVPLTYVSSKGDTYTNSTANFIYGIWYAPKYPGQKRSEIPDVFIAEIHPGYGELQFYRYKYAPAFSWRIVAEDLGGSHDWDFNDLVADFYDIVTFSAVKGNNYGYPVNSLYPKGVDLDELISHQITITPRASGGTLPIYLAWRGRIKTLNNVDNTWLSDVLNGSAITSEEKEGDFIIGTEMHKWLGGTSYQTPLNVGTKVTHTGKRVTFNIPYTFNGHNGDDISAIGMPGKPLSSTGFYVIVDPKNTLNPNTEANFDPTTSETDDKLGITQIDLTSWDGGYTVSQPNSESNNIPQMFIQNTDFNYSICKGDFRWPKEGVSIGDAYPNFHKIMTATSPSDKSWLEGWVEDLLVKRL